MTRPRRSAARITSRRTRMIAITAAAAVVVAGLAAPKAAPTAQAAAQAPQATAPPDYCVGQCADILPPGQNGNATFAELLAFKAFGTRPAHFSDTKKAYEDLVWNYQGITDEGLDPYFDDQGFGVAPTDVASTYKPRADVTIVRDKSRGIPHITGTTREGTMFGAGYAGANDRLFVMDVFRHLGRGQLTPFAGGAQANRDFEQQFWSTAPYTEAELQAQFDSADELYGADGVKMQRDIQAWVDGVNHYINTVGIAYPGEYVALGLPTPRPWKVTDVVATAAVVAGIFGGGGGGEMASALALIEARARYGVTQGTKVWEAFRSQNDVEANTTVHNGATFPYGVTEANPAGRALPDRGSVTREPLVVDQTALAGTAPKVAKGNEKLKGILKDGVFPKGFGSKGMSNALLVSGAHTQSGNPIAVYGPQTGYFAPQLWVRQELQGPGISSRGVAFVGLNFYTLIGRGQDYSWSATSAGQDITDTYAVPLCEPGGGTPTKASTHYVFRGSCLPIERLERHNEWYASLGSPEPAGSYTLVANRTKLGLITHRGTVGGKPVAFTKNRSTYGNESGSALGFMLFNDPNAVKSAQDFQRAAAKVGYAFNWFYADKTDIAYYNSGDNPVRPAGADPNLPTWGLPGYEWLGWNPATNRATYTPFAQHPQVVNQDFLTSWNNKQAPGFSASDGNFSFGAVHRSQPLDTRIKAVLGAGQKFTRGRLVEAMEDAATVDLRAEQVLPYLLRVLRSGSTDPAVADAIAKLEAWKASGSLRKTSGPGAVYSHSDAIRILDAWWPMLVATQFKALGPELYGALVSTIKVDERANHQGSAYQSGWWGFVQRDLRKVLGDPVKTPQPVTYCGGGDLTECRTLLADSLLAATKVPAATVYPASGDCAAGDQYCADSIVHQPMGGITQDRTHWVNRPTYQQVIEFPARRGDDVSNRALGKTATASSHETGWYNSPPANATDGNPRTRWASDWSDPQWLKVDLGAEQSVARVVLRWEAAYAKGYRIEVSRDGTSWRQVYATTAGNGGEDVARFPATAARYVRMTGTQRATSYGYSVYELEVYRH